MTAIARTHHTPTLSEIPFAITEVLLRNARREARRERLRRLFYSPFGIRHSALIHSARLGTETIESNLPL
jgi:hypothetical protein